MRGQHPGPQELPYLSSPGGELRPNWCVMAERISYVTESNDRSSEKPCASLFREEAIRIPKETRASDAKERGPRPKKE